MFITMDTIELHSNEIYNKIGIIQLFVQWNPQQNCVYGNVLHFHHSVTGACIQNIRRIEHYFIFLITIVLIDILQVSCSFSYAILIPFWCVVNCAKIFSSKWQWHHSNKHTTLINWYKYDPYLRCNFNLIFNWAKMICLYNHISKFRNHHLTHIVLRMDVCCDLCACWKTWN